MVFRFLQSLVAANLDLLEPHRKILVGVLGLFLVSLLKLGNAAGQRFFSLAHLGLAVFIQLADLSVELILDPILVLLDDLLGLLERLFERNSMPRHARAGHGHESDASPDRGGNCDHGPDDGGGYPAGHREPQGHGHHGSQDQERPDEDVYSQELGQLERLDGDQCLLDAGADVLERDEGTLFGVPILPGGHGGRGCSLHLAARRGLAACGHAEGRLAGGRVHQGGVGRRRGRCDIRQGRGELSAAFQNEFGVCLLDLEVLELFVPARVGSASPLDPVVARAFEDRQRLPPRFFLGLFGPALIFLQLLVELLLGEGVLVLGGLRVALESLDDLVACTPVFRVQGFVVGVVLGRELFRAGAVLGLFPVDPLLEPQLGLGFAFDAGRDQCFQVGERDGFFLNERRLRHVAVFPG